MLQFLIRNKWFLLDIDGDEFREGTHLKRMTKEGTAVARAHGKDKAKDPSFTLILSKM